MFERHFHFHIQPFAEHLPAERLWPDDRLTQGLARLRYLTTAGTLGLVTGASGVGKSALLKRFWHELRGPGIQACYVHLAQLSSNDLLRLLVRNLGQTPLWSKDQLLGQIRDHARQAEGTLLVLLDEAHLLQSQALKVRFSTFHTVGRHRTLARPTVATPVVYRALVELLDELDVGVRWVRLVGVSLGNLTHDAFQLTLDEGWREIALGAAVDQVREKYGFSALGLAGARARPR